MTEYDPHLENSSGRQHAQPNGVSEDPRNEGWGHRTEMEPVESEKRRSVSERVNERQAGELVRLGKKDHGKCGSRASNENDDKKVDEGKSTKQKYAEKYAHLRSDE